MVLIKSMNYSGLRILLKELVTMNKRDWKLLYLQIFWAEHHLKLLFRAHIIMKGSKLFRERTYQC